MTDSLDAHPVTDPPHSLHDSEAPWPVPDGTLPSGLWLHDLRGAAESKPSWLWEGYLMPGGVTLLTSLWKSGKTTLLALLLARLKEKKKE